MNEEMDQANIFETLQATGELANLERSERRRYEPSYLESKIFIRELLTIQEAPMNAGEWSGV